MKHVIVDIGANAGEFSFDLASRNPQALVLSVEPIPALYEALETTAGQRGLGNIRFVRAAVDIEPRMAQFHVAAHADWGVSSLYKFDEQAIGNNEYWKHRADLYFDNAIEVQVRRLDDILTEAGIETVDFIKIDAQGADVNVLRSAGAALPRIRAGVLEVSTSRHNHLYEHEVDDLSSALAFLSAQGFEVSAIKPNDPACNEVNVYFQRVGESLPQIEADLQLRGVALYDGRHFWHCPSGSAETSDFHRKTAEADALRQHAHALQQERETLAARLAELETELARSRSQFEQMQQHITAQQSAIEQLHEDKEHQDRMAAIGQEALNAARQEITTVRADLEAARGLWAEQTRAWQAAEAAGQQADAERAKLEQALILAQKDNLALQDAAKRAPSFPAAGNGAATNDRPA